MKVRHELVQDCIRDTLQRGEVHATPPRDMPSSATWDWDDAWGEDCEPLLQMPCTYVEYRYGRREVSSPILYRNR